MPKTTLAGPGTAYVAAAFRAKKAELGRRTSLRIIESRTGLSRETINRALAGKTTMALDTFIRLSRELSLDPVALVREAARLDADRRRVEVLTVEVGNPVRDSARPARESSQP